VAKRIFSYEEASALLPAVQELTTVAVARIEELDEEETSTDEYQEIIQEWADGVKDLGIEVKGLWLIDFDSGSGYYCWQHPEPSLQYFHGYEDGFGGRIKLN
jgi:hypothetical protein